MERIEIATFSEPAEGTASRQLNSSPTQLYHAPVRSLPVDDDGHMTTIMIVDLGVGADVSCEWAERRGRALLRPWRRCGGPSTDLALTGQPDSEVHRARG